MANQPRRYLEVVEIGDVTVISFLDQNSKEEDFWTIGKELSELVERDNRRKIVLDYSNVKYITSLMSSKIVALRRLVHSRGGQLALCEMDPSIYQHYEISGLDKLFRIYKTLEEAIDMLGSSPSDQFRITCPVQGCHGRSCVTKAMAGKPAWLRCPECEARISLRLPDIPLGGESMAEVFTVHLQTYTRDREEGKDEYMELQRGAPITLQIVGRLDLFTSAVFEKLWRSVPSPRRLIIDCSEAWDISERGAEVLARLITADREGRAVVVMKEDELPRPNTFPADIPIVTDRDKALGTLGELPKWGGYQFTAKITRRLGPEPSPLTPGL
jgi:anti-anti-sigma factor